MKKIHGVMDGGRSDIRKIPPRHLQLRLLPGQGRKFRREAVRLFLLYHIIDEAALAQLPDASSPGIKHAALLLLRHALIPADAFQLLPCPGSLLKSLQNHIRQLLLPQGRQAPALPLVPEGLPVPFIAPVIRSVSSGKKQGKILLCKDMHRPPYRPVFHQPLTRRGLVKVVAADFQGMECVLHELRLNAQKVPCHRYFIGRGKQILIGKLAHPDILRRHDFPFPPLAIFHRYLYIIEQMKIQGYPFLSYSI